MRAAAVDGVDQVPTGVVVPGLPGHGVVAVDRRADRSVIRQIRASSPLRLLAPKNHGRSVWIYTSTFGGGLVDGDRIVLDVTVGAGASLYLATQSATKVYRSPSGTSCMTTVTVDEDAVVVSAPDPVVCFKGARYAQAQDFDITGTSSIVTVDWLVSGRYARGERWAFDEYSSRTTVRVNGQPVTFDALRLSRNDGSIADRLGRFEIAAAITLVGPACVSTAAALIERSASELCVKNADLLMTAAPAGERGCLVRLAATSVERAVREVRRCLDLVPTLLGDDPWQRKW